MATSNRSRHPFIIQENPDYTFSILARRADGKEVWYGNYSAAQSAIRWGMAHRNQQKFPCAVMRELNDQWGVEAREAYSGSNSSPAISSAPDPVDRKVLSLLDNCGIDATNRDEVAEFLGKNPDDLEELLEFQNRLEGEGNRRIWQIRNI